MNAFCEHRNLLYAVKELFVKNIVVAGIKFPFFGKKKENYSLILILSNNITLSKTIRGLK